MNDSKLHKWVLITLLGAGIVMMGVLWNMDNDPPENHTQPQTSGIDQRLVRESGTPAGNNSVQPSDQQKHVAITPSDSTNLPNLDDTPSTVESISADSYEIPLDGNQIYTMDTLPRDKSGIFFVRDSDGNVIPVAVDVPGQDSPIGL